MKRHVSALKKEIPALIAVLREENPLHFGPDWIQHTDNRIYSRIYRRLNGNGWNDLVALLPRAWRFKWLYHVQRKGLSLKQEVRSVEKLLKEKRPSFFSPYWIDKQDCALYSRLKTKLPRVDGSIQWSRFVSLMRPEWQCLWIHTKSGQGMNATLRLGFIAREIGLLLEREKPESFGPKWLEQHDIHLYYQARPLLRQKKRKLEWRILLDLLEPEWQARWQRRRYAAGRPLELEIETERLKKLLETLSPDSFSADWIRAHDDALYRRLRRCLKTANNSPGWNLVLEQLGDSWRSKWRWYGLPEEQRRNRIVEPGSRIQNRKRWSCFRSTRRGRRQKTLEESVGDLEGLIERLQPDHFNPTWIEQNYPALYDRLRNHLRTVKQKCDWNRLIALLREPYQRKWRIQKTLEQYLPATMYRNPEEVDAALKKHADKLYTFVATVHKEDAACRDAVCRDLIRLAKHGNADAEERLLDLIYPLVENWTMTKKHLIRLTYDCEKVKDSLRKCIYYYQDGKARFLWYVWQTLSGLAKRLKTYSTISLDAPIRVSEKKNKVVLDTIGRFDSGETWHYLGERGEGMDVFA